MNFSEALHAPIDEVEKILIKGKTFAYQTDRLDHEMRHITSGRRQRDILSARDGDAAFLGHSRVFRDYGILESDAYDLLVSKYGLSPNHYSWTDKSEVDTDNIYNVAIHENTAEPNLVYAFEYSFSRVDNSWSGIRIATRRMNGLFQQLLKNPLPPHARDEEVNRPFTRTDDLRGEHLRAHFSFSPSF